MQASDTIRIALFSVTPPGLSTFQTFDPESFSLISLINDSLIFIDMDGSVQPGLATAWTRVSDTELELNLRRGVRFHNGEPFNADSVVATFRAHRTPTLSASARGVLGVITEATRRDEHTVRLHTAFPDAMLLRRLFISSIYPARLLETEGRDYFAHTPVGTGPYRLVRFEPGAEIVLERNPEHWSGRECAACLRFPIFRQNEWVDRLAAAEVDVAIGLDSHDRARAERTPGLRVVSRDSAITQWFLLRNRGALADRRVRRALNHAINRTLLVDITQHGFGSPQRSVAARGEEGYCECEPYRYSPELATELLTQAGHGNGLRLSGLVSETSSAVYFVLKALLERVNVELNAEIVPRAEWIRRVVGGNMSGKPYSGDFALAVFDNPVLHTLFHHFIFLFGQGPFSLLKDAQYDERFLAAARSSGNETQAALGALEQHARDEALLLFTVHEDCHAAMREGFSCELPRSGHVEADTVLRIRCTTSAAPGRSVPPAAAVDPQAKALLEATSHSGAFYLAGDTGLHDAIYQRIWMNILSNEQRWRLQNEPMLRALVTHAEAKANLANVLGSTERVGIVGYSAEGRRLFVNSGYQSLFGSTERTIFEYLGSHWRSIREEVDQKGTWVGPVHLSREGRPTEAPERLYLSVTRAVDEELVLMGYTFVFTNFTGEEERIRSQAIRTILDNVPYGLCLCDDRVRVLDGYSVACEKIFTASDGAIPGKPLPKLLGMSPTATARFNLACEQLFEDILPETAALANLPDRVTTNSRVYALSGSVIRDGTGKVSALLLTLLDVSDLSLAERELDSLRGLVHVMRHRTAFQEFATRFHRRMTELLHHADPREVDAQVRFELHTAKGVFGSLELRGLAAQCHELEERATITRSDLQELDATLLDLIAKNSRIWALELGDEHRRHSVPEEALRRLEADVRSAQSLDDLRALMLQGLAGLRRRTVAELSEPLSDACADLASRRGKSVRLEVDGGPLLWPQDLVPLFELLQHLVRNSIDHGIEAETGRGSKPAVAVVRLSARETDHAWEMTYQDDGAGIATDDLVARAVRAGLLTPDEAAQMSEEARVNLIFRPGLSTASVVTHSSGRGVGMSAVKQAVEALGGTLHVESRPGLGTRFVISFSKAGSHLSRRS